MTASVPGSRYSLSPPIGISSVNIPANSASIPDTPCLPYGGYISPSGYGQAPKRRYGTRWVHRQVFIDTYGFAPETVDHICHDPRLCPGGSTCPHRMCIEPSHMVAASGAVNSSKERSHHPGPPKPEACPSGHCYTDDNTYWTPEGHRACRTCSRAATRKWRQAHPKPPKARLPHVRPPCGTTKGYNSHRYWGEPTCLACRKAAADAYRAWRLKVPVPELPPVVRAMKPIEHGTPRGYGQHRARDETACRECKAAVAAAVLARKGGPKPRQRRQSPDVCVNGHRRTPKNTKINPKDGCMVCRDCLIEAKRRYRERKRSN